MIFAATVIALTLGTIGAPSTTERFVEANQLALSGDAPGAIERYEALLESGLVNEDLFFNLGNAYAQDERWLDAIVALERARMLAPWDRDIAHNLTQARRKLGGLATHDDDPLLVLSPIAAALLPAGAKSLALGSNVLLFLFLICLRRKWLSGLRTLFVALLPVVGLVLVSSLGLVVLYDQGLTKDRAVLRQDAPLRDGPNLGFSQTRQIPIGERVEAISQSEGWTKVRTSAGEQGFVPEESLIRLRDF